MIDSFYLLTNHTYQLSVSYVSQKCFHSYQNVFTSTDKYTSLKYQSFFFTVVGWCRCFRGDEYSNSISTRCIAYLCVRIIKTANVFILNFFFQASKLRKCKKLCMLAYLMIVPSWAVLQAPARHCACVSLAKLITQTHLQPWQWHIWQHYHPGSHIDLRLNFVRINISVLPTSKVMHVTRLDPTTKHPFPLLTHTCLKS